MSKLRNMKKPYNRLKSDDVIFLVCDWRKKSCALAGFFMTFWLNSGAK